MVAPATKTQLADLWMQDYLSQDGGHCGLCGNRGWIDTRGLKTPNGTPCGGVFWCICPNGRVRKKNAKTPRPILV